MRRNPFAFDRTTPHAWCSLIACLAGAALLLAGCGSSGGADKHGPAVLRRARHQRSAHRDKLVSASVIAGSARRSAAELGYAVTLSFRVDVGELGGEATATGNGAFDADAGDVRLRLTLPGMLAVLGPVSTPAVVADGSAYVEVPQQLVGQGSGLPPWVSVSLSGAGQLLGLPSAALGGALTPRAIIEALARDSTGQADVLAEQTIGGVPTMHYREAGRQFGSGYAIDVWVDSATGLLRRIALIPAGASKSAGAGAGSGATVQIDFTAYGPQKVTAPPPASQVGSLAAALQKFGI